jgi:hypothetical protein
VAQTNVNSGNVPLVTGNVRGMRQDAYQRTLEYVQQCQSWAGSDMVSSSTHPLGTGSEASSLKVPLQGSTSNMVINDMTSSLTSLLEENRYLQMIQWIKLFFQAWELWNVIVHKSLWSLFGVKAWVITRIELWITQYHLLILLKHFFKLFLLLLLLAIHRCKTYKQYFKSHSAGVRRLYFLTII